MTTHDLIALDTPGPAPTGERLRLFCLPHGGGNAAHFALWRHWLPANVDVVPVDLPGHGTRLREPLIGEWEALVEDLVEVVGRQVDGPYAVFGHSLGALLAFEIARTIQRRGGIPPVLLVAAGHNGPSASPSRHPIHGLGDEQFLGALRRLGGIPDGVLHQPELLRMFLPALRTDLRLAERYERAPGPRLSCPVLAFAGSQDGMTDQVGMLAWNRETTDACELVLVEGGHFLLQEDGFTEALAKRLHALTHR